MSFHYELAVSAHPWFRTNIGPFHTQIVCDRRDNSAGSPFILNFEFYCPQAVESSHIELFARRREVGDYQFVMQIAYRTLQHPTRGAFLDWLRPAAHCARAPCPFRLNLPNYTPVPSKKTAGPFTPSNFLLLATTFLTLQTLFSAPSESPR